MLFGFSRASARAYPGRIEAKGGPHRLADCLRRPLPAATLSPRGGPPPRPVFNQQTNGIKRRDRMNAETPVDPAKGCPIGQDRFHSLLGRTNKDWWPDALPVRSEEHTSELQSLMRISYAVFCLKKKNIIN